LVIFYATHFLGWLNAQNASVYVCDAGNFNYGPWKILQFDENGENGQVFIDDHLAWPQDILFLEDKNIVLISNYNSGRISKFNATTGDFIGEFATGIGGPTRMEMGPEGLLYVLQAAGNGRVRRYNLDGGLVDELTTVGVSNSIGIDWDADGNFYVSSYTDANVRKFSPSGAHLGLFINSNLAGPTNIWFAENGDLLVLDFDGAAVKRFNKNGAYLGVFIAGLPQCEGVEFLPNGNLLIGSGGTSSVREYDSDGNFLGNFVPPGTLGLLTPNAIVLRNGNATATQQILRQDLKLLTPTAGAFFQISKPEEWGDETTLMVYNAAGVVVHIIDFTNSTALDASNWPSGVYFLLAKSPKGFLGRQRFLVGH
jgi:hypothetical protein